MRLDIADIVNNLRFDGADYVGEDELVQGRELLNTMAALTSDDRFRELAVEMKEGDEPKDMCEVLAQPL